MFVYTRVCTHVHPSVLPNPGSCGEREALVSVVCVVSMAAEVPTSDPMAADGSYPG